MAAIGQYIYNYLSAAMSGTNLSESSELSVADVLHLKQFFIERAALPVELIDAILDYAEYWPCTTTTTSGKIIAVGRFTNDRRPSRENKFLLRSFPIGFSPSSNHYQISKPSLEDYQRMAPSPWPNTKEIPQNATEELLANWASKTSATTEHPCRKIVFTIKSHDQGIGGEPGCRGSYRQAYSWFEAGLEKVSAMKEKHVLEAWKTAPRPQFEIVPPKPDDESLPVPIVCSLRTVEPATKLSTDPHILPEDEDSQYTFDQPVPASSSRRIQANIVASRHWKEHIVTWSCYDDIDPDSAEAEKLEEDGRGKATGDGKFVRSLKVGDVVTVWAKARFPGWINEVESVKMDVYWAV